MPLTVAALTRYPMKSGRGESLQEATVERLGFAGDRRWMVVDPDGETVTAREFPRLLLVGAALVGDGIRLSAEGHGSVLVDAPADPDADGSGGAARRMRARVHSSAPLEVGAAGPEANDWLSGWIGAEVRLVHADGATRRMLNPAFTLPTDSTAFADAYPILATTEASLARVNEWIAAGPLAAQGPLDMRRFRPNVVIAGGEAFDEDRWRRLRIGSAVFRAPKGCDRCVMTTTDPDTAARGKEPIATLARHRRWDGATWFGMNLVPDSIGAAIRVGDEVEILETAESDGPPRAGVA